MARTSDTCQRPVDLGALDTDRTLRGTRFELRPLSAADHGPLAAIAADPRIWSGHPNKAMATPEGFDPWFAKGLADGSAYVVMDRDQAAMVGSTRFYMLENLPGAISIGYTFLARAYWGGMANREIKTLMLDHAFAVFPEVWFHIAVSNLRSQRATEKFGPVLHHSEWRDLTGGPMEWLCYRLTQAGWQDNREKFNGRGAI